MRQIKATVKEAAINEEGVASKTTETVAFRLMLGSECPIGEREGHTSVFEFDSSKTESLLNDSTDMLSSELATDIISSY